MVFFVNLLQINIFSIFHLKFFINFVKKLGNKYCFQSFCLPIYTGLPNDEEQGLCIGTENYVAVNTLASEEDQLASIAFLEWLYSSDVGKSYVTNELQFITVFNTFSASDAPSNPLAVEVSSYLNDTSKSSVPWNFTSFPGQEFEDGLSNHLYAYATGQEGWEKVDEFVVQKWAEMKSGE